MTDADLLALVERKSPDELTGEEVDILLRRLADSPALRHELLARPGMDAYVTAALGRARADLEPGAASQQARKRGSRALWLLLLMLLGLPLAALVVAVLVNIRVGEERQESKAPPSPTKTDAGSPRPSLATDPPVEPSPKQAEAPAQMQIVPLEKLAGEAKPLAKPAPPPAEPLVEPPAPAPWQAGLNQAEPLPPYEQVAFTPDEQAFSAPTKSELEQWFAKTPEAGFRISTISSQAGQRAAIEGVGKLLCPWPADGVLRLKLENFNRLKLHFFHEQVGASLIYYEDQGYRWAAYATMREAGQPTPRTWAITATDDDRCKRSELRYGGPIELRYRHGEVILSRGDIVLLSAPLPGPPTDVYFEGRATIHGLALARAAGSPAPLPAGPIVKEITRPGDLKWTMVKPDAARPLPAADGSLRLAASNAKEQTACTAALPELGLHEVVLELSDVTPGAGVFLGRADRKMPEVLRFYSDRRSGQLAAKLYNGDSNEWQAEFDAPADKPSPLVQSQCWVKLLYGCGNVRYWLSGDGVHWAQPEMARENAPPDVASIGLQVVANRPDAGITLKRISLRRLDGLSSLAPAELLGQAPATIDGKSLADWLAAIDRQVPAGVELPAWRRAGMVRAVGAGAPRELAYPLLEALLDDAASRHLPAAQQLAALDDAMLLAGDLRDGQAMKIGLLTRYARLGIEAAEHEGLPAWTAVRQHYHSAPVNTWLQMPVDLDRVIRWELVTRTYQPASDNLDFIHKLRFFRQDRDRPLVDWVELLARRRIGRPLDSDAAIRLKDGWRELLVEELNKETYNALTELKAVLDSEAWDDAARLITGLDPRVAPGVAPYVNDRSLLVSLPVAIELALAEYPELRQSLADKYGDLARLRISQATASGDAAALELTAVQFAGTPVLAEVHQWLGDRALTGGAFERALGEYGKARALDGQRGAALAPRIRLAAAMLGRDAESPVTEPVQFGELSLSPVEFEAIVGEMRERGATSGGTAATGTSVQPPAVPPPASFAADVRARLEEFVGERPQEEVGRRTNQHRVPWADRQIATVADGDTLYVSNRFHMSAYDLAMGQRRWQCPPLRGPLPRAQEWAMIAMRPLLAGQRLYARMLYSVNPVLVCSDKATGKPVWVAETRDGEFFVSDPLLVDGRLVCLSIAIQEEQQGLLRWLAMDAETGELIAQRDLLRLRNTWGARSCCEVAATGDGLVAALGGITLAIDAEGSLRWLRTQETLPADEDPRWVLQMYQQPLVREGRMYVAQPGVRTVDCLDVSTGRRRWSAVLPEVVSLVGVAGDLLIVRTEAGLQGLQLTDGKTQWWHNAAQLHSFQVLDYQRLLIASRERVPNQNDKWQTRLTWLDPASGQEQATTVPSGLVDADPRLGPLIPYHDRIFTFFGRGQHDPTRDFVELTPDGEAVPAAHDAPISK